MIEVTPEMWERKAKMARGEIPFEDDRLCDELLALPLPEFRKYSPRWQHYAGMHGVARRKFESLKETESLKENV
jgi:hypothetical protein